MFPLAKVSATPVSAVFDLDNRTVQIMKGNPSKGQVYSTWDVGSLLFGGCNSGQDTNANIPSLLV